MAESQTMKIVIQALDQTKGVLEKLNKDLLNINTSTKKADTALGVLRKGFAKFRESISNVRRQLFTLKNVIIGAIVAFGAFKIYNYVKGSTLLAARYKTLGVTVATLGKQAGYTNEELKKYEEGLQNTGIAALQTRTIMAKMIQSQLDMSKATELGRVAQDAAVIAGLNSSETFERMIHAIQANSVEILRTIGMNVSFERSYKKFAKTLDIAVGQMTEAQKVQARFNAVLDGGIQIAGAYGAAMTTAGKKLLSFARYVSNFRLEVGRAFESTLATIVDSATKALKGFTKVIKDDKFQQEMEDFGKIIGSVIENAFKWLIDNKDLIINVIKIIVKAMGNAITSLTYLLDLLITSQDDIVNKQRKNLERLTGDLAKFVSEREILKEKLLKQEAAIKKGFFGTKTEEERTEYWLARLDFGKARRRVRELDALIKKYTDLSKDLDAQIRKTEEPPPVKRESGYTESSLPQFFSGLKPEKPGALGSSLLVSAFKRANADIKLELAKLESDYDKNLIFLTGYYDKRAEIALRSYELEKKLLESQAAKEPNLDKRLKIQDKIYSIQKNYEISVLKLLDDRLKAEKELAADKLEIEKTLQSARLSLASKSSSIEVQNKYELDQLKISQKERLEALKEGKASRDQLKEAEIISNQEQIQLAEEQEKRASEKTLEIQKILSDARLQLVDPNNLKAVFDAEMQVLKEQQAERLQTIVDAKMDEGEKLKAIEEANRLSELEKDRLHAEQRLKVQEKYVDGVKNVFSNLNSLFGDLYELSGSEAKKWFNIQKAISIAQATIATYESAILAFKSFAGLGPVGVAMGYAAAGVAVAAGLAKIAVIRSQSYAAGGEVKGFSPTPTADNITANVTSGEYIHPVDVVKYYGLKGMEIIRKKLIPPELIYQASVLSEKKDLVKQSFENNIERTASLIKEYSKKILGISKTTSDKPSYKSSISTPVVDRTLVDRLVNTSTTNKYIDKSAISQTVDSIESKSNSLRETSIIEKSIGFIKNIADPIKKLISVLSKEKIVVNSFVSPVIIKDVVSKSESFVKLKSDELRKMKIASNFIKVVESRTSQTIQQLAGGGAVMGFSPTPTADNITIGATAGEFMHPVDVVKYYTSRGMEAIRQKLVPREVIAQYANAISMPVPNYTRAFAVGGEVGNLDKGSQKPTVIINLENNTGEDIEVEEERTTFDGEKMITDLVLKKFMTSRSYRQALRGR